MRLVTYDSEAGLRRAGVLVSSGLVLDGEELALAAGLSPAAALTARTTRGLLELGEEPLRSLERAAMSGRDGNAKEVASLRLGPPITNPEKIICLGLNYRDHAEEMGLEVPATPTVFAKFANSLAGPYDDIVIPASSAHVDYEAEIAVVIGRRCRDVIVEEAERFVAGVMAFNDVSARDLQMSTSQWTLGKAIDTFAPCGPALVLLKDVEDVQALGVKTRLNGRTVQSSNTAEMIFPVFEAISLLSRLMTLVPGDIIATGTPAGVGLAHDPVIKLADGDVVEVEVEGVGVLRNPVMDSNADGTDADAPFSARIAQPPY